MRELGKSRIGVLLATLGAAMAGMAFGDGLPAQGKARRTAGTRNGSRTGTERARGRVYPEQSQRQGMRKFRRAQGGPGIYFNDLHGMYLPRGAATPEGIQHNPWRVKA